MLTELRHFICWITRNDNKEKLKKRRITRKSHFNIVIVLLHSRRCSSSAKENHSYSSKWCESKRKQYSLEIINFYLSLFIISPFSINIGNVINIFKESYNIFIIKFSQRRKRKSLLHHRYLDKEMQLVLLSRSAVLLPFHFYFIARIWLIGRYFCHKESTKLGQNDVLDHYFDGLVRTVKRQLLVIM